MLPLETRKAIAADYANGVKVQAIAAAYGIDESTPTRIAAQFGIKQRRPSHRKVTPEMEDELCYFYLNSKQPMKVKCEEFGISESCASKIVAKRGLRKKKRASAGVHVSLDMLEKKSLC